jgi:hypothetical protein
MSNMNESGAAAVSLAAGLVAGAGLAEGIEAPHFRYHFECLDADGNVKWVEEFHNTVLTAGKNDLLDKYFAGSSYTAAWFLGLVDNASFTAIAAGDTPSSHAGWIESTAYSNANRITLAFSAASSGSKVTSAAASFSINGTATINGAFTTTLNTKGGTTGVMYSAGSFGAARSVLNGDTLNVSLTLSV